MQTLTILLGLALSAWGHVLLGERPRVVLIWERLDALFSPYARTPAPAAGGLLLASGASLVLVGMLG